MTHRSAPAEADVVLLSTYELGRQPFGVASAAAWLADEGLSVAVHDLAVHRLDPAPVEQAAIVGVYLPMHTATRLAEPLIHQVVRINPSAHLVAFGLYAPLSEARLRSLGVHTVIGGEFERALRDVCSAVVAGRTPAAGPPISRERLALLVPDRSGLPALDRYAGIVIDGELRPVGSTEASRGCRHRCRHCPIVPVYDGRYRVVPEDVVLADIAAQVEAGARHITFGDPDFLNGPMHAMRVVRRFRESHPSVTFDVTIKVEHLLAHRDLLPELRDSGCVLVTSAVESFDDVVLSALDKGHTSAGAAEAVEVMRSARLALNATFVAFTPWTTVEGYRRFLQSIADLGLIDSVSPVQYGIRLLVTAGSRLLELEDIAAAVGEFDPGSLAYPWDSTDPAVDALQAEVMQIAQSAGGRSRRKVFRMIWEAAGMPAGLPPDGARPVTTIPYLTEPWYC